MKKGILYAMVIALATLFVAGGLYAETVEDVIPMKNKKYDEHKKGIVEFTHKKHAEDYAKANPKIYDLGCGECHHDKEGKPLTDLKMGDEVQSCIECHSKPGEKPKGRDAPKLSKEEERQYHAEAIHDNCRGCHREFNRAKKTKAAPTTCSKCHPKTKK